MILAALDPAHELRWWISLGLGLVVAVVVVALLSWLVVLVTRIDRGVGQVWHTATGVARNTATTWQLASAANKVSAVADEVGRHVEALTALGTSAGKRRRRRTT